MSEPFEIVIRMTCRSSQVIEAINVPPESQLTMLGPFDTSVTDGLKTVLDLSEQQQGIFGVSVVTPNGEKHREYIQTKP
mgnify:CR=1 FL=1